MTANAKPKQLSSMGGVPCNERITQIITLCPKFDVRENAQPPGAQHQPCPISWWKFPGGLNSGLHFGIRLCQKQISKIWASKIVSNFLVQEHGGRESGAERTTWASFWCWMIHNLFQARSLLLWQALPSPRAVWDLQAPHTTQPTLPSQWEQDVGSVFWWAATFSFFLTQGWVWS